MIFKNNTKKSSHILSKQVELHHIEHTCFFTYYTAIIHSNADIWIFSINQR